MIKLKKKNNNNNKLFGDLFLVTVQIGEIFFFHDGDIRIIVNGRVRRRRGMRGDFVFVDDHFLAVGHVLVVRRTGASARTQGRQIVGQRRHRHVQHFGSPKQGQLFALQFGQHLGRSLLRPEITYSADRFDQFTSLSAK